MHIVLLSVAIALSLLAGCGASDEQRALEVYQQSRRAIEAGDLATLQTLVSAEHAKDFDGPGAEMMLEIARSAMPEETHYVESSLADGEITLTFTGRSVMDDGDSKLAIPAEGSVRMVEEAGAWKIAKEDWNMQLDLATPIFDVRPFLREGQRPVALKILEGHASGATAIAHTPNWKHLVTISYGDYSLRLWDVQSGELLAMRTLESRPTSLAMSANGQTLVTAAVDGDVTLWSLDAFGALGEPQTILRDAGQYAALSPNGEWLVVTSFDAPAVVYDFQDFSAAQTLAGSEKLRSISFSPSGELLAGSEGNQLVVWDTSDWSSDTYTLEDVSPDSSNGPIAFSPDGRHLGIPCGDSSIVVFDLERRRETHNFFVSEAAAIALEFSPDASMFATAQNNQQINIWSMEDHKRVGYILAKPVNATALHFSPDGRYLIAGHEDREVVFWGVAADGEQAAVSRESSAPAADAPQLPKAQTPERVGLLSRTNYLNNPNANQQAQFWTASGEASIEACGSGNPCFTTRWDGQFVGTAELPADAAGKFVLLIGSASAERVHEGDRDQAGESYIHGYGEALDPKRALGKHYSAETLQTVTRQPDTWSTLWGVFPVDAGIRKIHFELRQSDGSSAKTGSASRFDDLGVFLFDSARQAEAFVYAYEREVGRVSIASDGAAAQPVAKLAPASSEPESSQPADPGAAIVSCRIDGRVVFTRRAQCAQAGGR